MANNLFDIDSDYSRETFKDILLKGPRAVSNYIFNLLSSNVYESYQFNGDRIYEPTYGCMLEHKLFEPVDRETASDIVDIIYDALSDWIPELGIGRGDIGVEPTEDEQGYRVIIMYRFNDLYEKLRFTIGRGGANADN